MKKHFDLWDPFSPGISPRFSFSSRQAAASPRGGGGGAVPASPPAKAGALTSRLHLGDRGTWPGRPVPGPAPRRRRYSPAHFADRTAEAGCTRHQGHQAPLKDGIPETALGPSVPLTPLTLRGGAPPTTAHNSLKESSTLFFLSPLRHPLLTPSQLPPLKSLSSRSVVAASSPPRSES